MALRWIEGFETWGVLNDERSVWGDTFYGRYHGHCDSGTPKLVTGYESIGFALRNGDIVSNYFVAPFDNQPTWVVGCAYYIPSSIYYFGETIFRLRDDTTNQLWLAIQRDKGSSTHEINVMRGASTVVDSLGFFAPSQWIFIEMKATIHNSTGSYECKVNGSSVCSDTGVDTSQSGNAYANGVLFGHTAADLDDIYILDGTAGENDFLGKVKVEKGMPTSDYSVAWTRSAGSNNYETVDEIPCSESDYNYSKTAAQTDLFGVTSLGSSGVKGAQLSVQTKLSVPGGKKLTLLCDSSGSQQSKSEQIGEADDRVTATLVTDIDPDTSSAWTQSGINAAKWGVKVG
jgi:hypothetical protein